MHACVFIFQVSRLKLLSRPGSLAGSGSDIVVAVLSDSVFVYPACNGQGHTTAIYDVIGHPVSCVDGDGSDLAVGISAFDDLSNVYKVCIFIRQISVVPVGTEFNVLLS